MKKLILYSLAIVAFAACSRTKTITPVEKKLVEAVYASGKIVPTNDYKIYSLADGTIMERPVNEGDSITIGQLLYTVDNAIQNTQTATARTVFGIAEENYGDNSPVLLDLKYQLSSLQLKLQDDSINFVRLKNLYEQKSTTQLEYDRARLRFETSKNDVKSAKDRYNRTRNQLKLDYENAKGQLNVSQQQGNYYNVKSSVNGLIYELYKKPGEAVRRFEPLAAVGDRNSFYMQLWVDEQDVGKVKVGQEVAVTMDLYSGKTFKAKVTKVYPVLNEQNQSIRVEAVFTEPMPTLIANAIVEANIIVGQKEKVLTLPKQYITGDSVKLKGEDKYTRIKKGIESTDEVEIVEGLTPTSEVEIPE